MSQSRPPGSGKPGSQARPGSNQGNQGNQGNPANRSTQTGRPASQRTNTGAQSGQPNRSGQPARKPGTTGGAQARTTPPVARPGSPARRPGAAPAQQGGFRATIDRVFPPFSAQRYVAIWVLGMIPLIIILLVLLQPWGKNNSGAAGTTSSACAAPNTPGKYFVVDTVKGCIVAKLYTDASANVSKTVANFEQKANSGFFNNLTFHRVEDWVIQGGDPQGNGTGGGTMPSEYNNLPFKRGALGVARGNDPAKNNDSQFFIVKSDADYLNGQYTNWGQVVQGMDVVDKIAIGDKMTKVTVENK